MNTIPKAHLFEPLLRLSVGMDDMFSNLETLSMKSTYPPHDIIKVSDDEYLINMALAGFDKKELSVSFENGYLSVGGIGGVGKTSEDDGVQYIYRGISARTFTKSFKIAENIEVKDVTFNNGILSIKLVKIPMKDTIKVIKIN